MAQATTAHVAAPPAKPLDSIEAPSVSPRRGAILVVEDRDDVRQGLTQLLELHGFLVLDAADGDRALEHLGTDPDGIALMLLDLMLPGSVSGDDLRSRQLDDYRIATIPTIVVSACEPDVERWSQLRPHAWLEKPFRFDDLLDMVKKFVIPEAGPGLQQ